MPFLYKLSFKNNSIGIVFSISVLLSFVYLTSISYDHAELMILPLILLLLCGFFLLHWWYSRIWKNYLEKIRKTEIDSYKKELREQSELIQKLKDNNDELAKIIHKDNKLIPAMELAVYDFLETHATLSPTGLDAKGQELIAHLKTMSHGRDQILTNYRLSGQQFPTTGISPVDAILTYMQNRAAQEKVSFQVSVLDDINPLTQQIPLEDFTHLLSDLLENALIAAKHVTNGRLSVRLGILHNSYMVEISDNGAPFLPEVLNNFGRTPHTTHADDGGSGIGLMDIWNIKKNYRASIHIHEYDSDSVNVTKKLIIFFDKKNHYIIQTYRPMDILQVQTRPDLVVIPND